MDELSTRIESYREALEKDATDHLSRLLGSEVGKKAAARVAIAFSEAARKSKKPMAFLECSEQSVMNAVINCANTRLYPSSVLSPVWLVPKARELQWWLSHRGEIRLCQRAGFQLIPVPVAAGENVTIQFGEVTAHEGSPDVWATKLDQLQGVYLTIRRLSDGVVFGRPWLPRAAIEMRRAKALTKSIWDAWPVAMAQKTIIHWAMGRGLVPAEAEELIDALSREPQVVDANYVVKMPDAETPAATGSAALGVAEDPPDFQAQANEFAAKREGQEVRREEPTTTATEQDGGGPP